MQTTWRIPLGRLREVGRTSSAQLIQRLAELPPVANTWDSLGAAWNSPMQHFIWARAAIETLSAPGQLGVVMVGPVHQPIAIAPLVRRRRLLPQWELLSVPEIYAPMDFLYAGAHSLADLVNTLVSLRAPLLLKRMPADSPAIAALQEAYRARGLVITTPDEPCPWIPLDEKWLDPEQQLNAGRRSDFRRLQRRAEKIGPVTYEVLSPTPEQLRPLLEEAYQIEAASWKGSTGSALIHDRVRRNFFSRYAEAACQKGILRMAFLRIGGQGAAMHIAAECGGAYWLLRVGYDRTFAHCSPGMLLLLHTIKFAAGRELSSYELLGPPEPWMEIVTQSSRPCVQLRTYPFGVRGMAALAADTARLVWRRSKRFLRGMF